MKQSITGHLVILFSLFWGMNTFAATEVTIDGLRYSLDGTYATIVGYEGSLPENLVIPEKIEYNNLFFEVVKIANDAFSYNDKLKTIEAPYSIRYIGETGDYGRRSAFYQCPNLEKVHFPGVNIVGNKAFANCSKLKIVNLGNDLKEIYPGAFLNCTSLTYIVFPSTLTRVGTNIQQYGAFANCNMLQTVIFLGNNKVNGIYGISSFNYYTRGTIVSWNDNSFDYTGSEPVISYVNNLPAGFKVTSSLKDISLSKDAGTYTQDIPFTFANDDMSFDVEIPYTYTINPVMLKAKAKDASRVYGDGNPEFSSTYTGFVNNEDESVVTSHGSFTTTATEKSDVGTYSIKQTGATAKNYVFEYEDGTLTVNKAPLIMKANDKSMIYGGALPVLDAKYEGLKNNETLPIWINEPTFATTATSASKVGTYPITISNADAKNYQLTVNEGTMHIEKAELTVKVDDKNRIYGDANPEFTLSYTGLKNNETFPEWEIQPNIGTTADINSPVGSYPVSVMDAVAVNYNITANDGTLTINKAELQVTPMDATRKYGEENPKFELSYAGLKNNENVPEWTTEPVIITNATGTSAVGDYAIQISSAEARNYTLENKVGTLTITKAPLVIGINDYSRKYGEANPTFELNYKGLLNGETAPDWTQLPTITTEAEMTSDVGNYPIKGEGGILKNYEATEITPGQLTITPVSLTIRANDTSRLYYENNPEFSFSCAGFIGNDDASVLIVKPQMKTGATLNSNVGIYPIEISGAESKNYIISYEKGQLSINKRQLTVSTKDYTRTYGEENPTFELSYTGFVNNEDESVLITKPKATTKATSNSDVDVYDITISNGFAENYDFTYLGGKLTLEKAYQTLVWEQDLNEVMQYEQVELTAEASSGLDVTYTIEGSQICTITKIGKKQFLDCTGEGEAVIVAIQEGNKNYWQTTKKYKPITIKSATGINTKHMDLDQGVKVYDVSGNRFDKLKKGINILRMSNGKTKKVVAK